MVDVDSAEIIALILDEGMDIGSRDDSPALQPEQLEVLPHAVHGVEHVGTGGLAP